MCVSSTVNRDENAMDSLLVVPVCSIHIHIQHTLYISTPAREKKGGGTVGHNIMTCHV